MNAQKLCQCGCGAATKGGAFLPGHDARLRSSLLRRHRIGIPEATQELKRRNWDYGSSLFTLPTLSAEEAVVTV